MHLHRKFVVKIAMRKLLRGKGLAWRLGILQKIRTVVAYYSHLPLRPITQALSLVQLRVICIYYCCLFVYMYVSFLVVGVPELVENGLRNP